MAQLTLFINTSNNTLVAGRQSTQPLGTALPLFFGDTLSLVIYLLQLPEGYNGQDPANSQLETVSTAGLQLLLYLDDGDVAGTIYTQEVAFQTDANNEFFYAPLALNTDALKTLLGANTSAQAWLKIGYVQGGLQTTVLSLQVTIQVGLPTQPLVVPAGLTPLSAEVANATYLSLNPVPGRAIYLESPDGTKMVALMLTNDGIFQANPIAP